MPCHVPSASAPSMTGTCSETSVSMVFIWAGMSSGPSTSWSQPALVGARRSSAVARSVRTSGSAFSWMKSAAEVWRMKRSSAPVLAPVWSINRRAVSVISMKPCPLVSTDSVAVAINSDPTEVIADNWPRTASSSGSPSGLVENVLLQRHDHLDQAAPDLLHEIHDLVEIGIVGQLQPRLLRLGRRLLRLDHARQRQIARD